MVAFSPDRRQPIATELATTIIAMASGSRGRPPSAYTTSNPPKAAPSTPQANNTRLKTFSSANRAMVSDTPTTTRVAIRAVP